jgi:hypothetical protein
MKTLDWSVETLGLDYNSTGFLIIYLNQSSERNLNFYSIVYSMAAARLHMHNDCKLLNLSKGIYIWKYSYSHILPWKCKMLSLKFCMYLYLRAVTRAVTFKFQISFNIYLKNTVNGSFKCSLLSQIHVHIYIIIVQITGLNMILHLPRYPSLCLAIFWQMT